MADLLSKENTFRQPIIKVGFLLVFEVLLAFLTSFSFRQLILDFSPQRLILFSVSLSLFLVFFFLAALLVRGFLWLSLAAGLSVFPGLAIFYSYSSLVSIVFGILVFLIFLWGIGNLQTELESSLKIRFFRLAKVFLAKATLGVSILITVFCYFLFPTTGGLPISFRNFQFFIESNERLIVAFIPDFSSEKPVQTVLAGLVEGQLKASTPDFEKLPIPAKSGIIKEAIQGQLDSWERLLGLKIEPQERVDKVIYGALETKFSQFNEVTKTALTLSIFVLLFLMIKTLFIPIRWLVSGFTFLVYLFLLAINFASTSLESRSKEGIKI